MKWKVFCKSVSDYFIVVFSDFFVKKVPSR